jgi:methyl-accepting chemotaxis protein
VAEIRATVVDISSGLEAEQITTNRCVAETRAAETALEQIQQAVSAVNELTQDISASANLESERALQMRQRLSNVVTALNQTDVTIERMTQSAEAQNNIVNNMMATTRSLKFARI